MSAEDWAERKTGGLIKPHLNHEDMQNWEFSRLIKINLNYRTQVYLCHPMSQYFKAGDEEKKAKIPNNCIQQQSSICIIHHQSCSDRSKIISIIHINLCNSFA